MRILLLHAPYFQHLWREAGHDVRSFGSAGTCDVGRLPFLPISLGDVLRMLPQGWDPELIVWGDDSRLPRVLGLERAPCPLAVLSVDTHHHLSWHRQFARAATYTFVAQKDYLPEFAAVGVDARWLPCWGPADPPLPARNKRYAVSFVGTVDPRLNPSRVALMAGLSRELPLHVASGAYAPVYAASKVVVNQTVAGDLNMRVFEAMACGALLVTEHTGNGLLELFADRRHLVTYPRGAAPSDIAVLVRRYLADEQEREAIAAAGMAQVRAHHLEGHRAGSVLAAVKGAALVPTAGDRAAGLARAYHIAALRAARLAAAAGNPRPFRQLAQLYLDAALALAANPAIGEAERLGILGAVALARGELTRARFLLAASLEMRSDAELISLWAQVLALLGDHRGAARAAKLARRPHAAGPPASGAQGAGKDSTASEP